MQPPPALDELQATLRSHGRTHRNLTTAALIELCLIRGEGFLADNGALVVDTGSRTGRSPKDRFIVAEPAVESLVDWNAINQPLPEDTFARLVKKAARHLADRELFVFDGFAGSDPNYRLPVRIITERAWHSLFARTLFCRPTQEDLATFRPELTVINLPDVHPRPAEDGTPGTACVALSFAHRLVLILGTEYAGETKKSVFSYLNFVLPARDVFPMHCSANVGPCNETALFFGLSGTGKTTLSADPERRLIGDDEHGWSDTGIFNFEGGCYAKTIRLSPRGEPLIFRAIRFGSVLENVAVDRATRVPNYDDDRKTENTRATYPLDHIDNANLSGRGDHPHHVVFLTCDAFGVLPPLSRLTHEQAVEHFLLGYTAKIAGTETGVTQPEATFSTCFGAPFMPLRPQRYAELLRQRLTAHGAQVWLLNTGWAGGPAGQARRIDLAVTRQLLAAVLANTLSAVAFTREPVFGLEIPTACPGVPTEVLTPRSAWRDPSAYDAAAQHLAERFAQQRAAGYASGTFG